MRGPPDTPPRTIHVCHILPYQLGYPDASHNRGERAVASFIIALRHDEEKASKQNLRAFVFLAKVLFRLPYQPAESTDFSPNAFPIVILSPM